MGKSIVAVGLIAIAFSTPAVAQHVAIDLQGTSPNRVAVYAKPGSLDRTPINDEGLAGPRIRELKVTMVYEAAERPYWTEMALQFQCPNASALSAGTRGRARGRKSAAAADSVPSASSAEYRVSRGETKWKQKEETEQLEPTDWQSTSSYLLMRAYRIACQDAALRDAFTTATNEAGTVDNARLGGRLAALGLKDVVLAPTGHNVYDVADFTWSKIWADAPRPAVAYRNVTPDELAQLETEVAAEQERSAQLAEQARGLVDKFQRDNAFVAEAARLRDGRELSKAERMLLDVWLGKGEREVVARNGPPSVGEAGGIRFLSYGRSYDNRVLWSNIHGGNLTMTGGHESCNLTYGLTQDEAGEWRVYDVKVQRERSGDLAGTGVNTCRTLYEVPGQ